MDAVMSSLLSTDSKIIFYKTSLFKWAVALLFIVALLAATPYGYSYYQHSLSAKNKQAVVKTELSELLSAADVAEYNWMRTLNPKAASIEGGIVWSQEKQEGIMKFENLPAVSKHQQYRLSIYDISSDDAILGASFRQNSFDQNTRLVSFKPEKLVKSPYKFILSLENIDGKKESDVLLRAQP